MNKEHSIKRIAILGASSHIAKGLIDNFSRRKGAELVLYARAPKTVEKFLETIGSPGRFPVKTFDDFRSGVYDVIINCVGIGEPQKLRKEAATIFRLTESFDNLVLDYLADHPDAVYVNFSSGAVYGTDFSQPADDSSCTLIDVNHLEPTLFYGIAKLHSEAKHRALKDRNIVDLRVFGYFSRYIDLGAKYLMSEIISCVQAGKEFVTGPGNIIRDYVHPRDLASLIEKCIEVHGINDAFDVYSLKPVAKFDILDYFAERYGLKYVVTESQTGFSPTGSKDHYYSNSKKARDIGHIPRFTSLDCIIQESRELLASF